MEEQNNNGQLQIELREEVAQGTYANLAIITHSSSEFILDFVRIMPGIPKAGVQSRIIVAPEHAKRLLRALEDNIAKYERVFGPIRTSDEPSLPPLAGSSFKEDRLTVNSLASRYYLIRKLCDLFGIIALFIGKSCHLCKDFSSDICY